MKGFISAVALECCEDRQVCRVSFLRFALECCKGSLSTPATYGRGVFLRRGLRWIFFFRFFTLGA